MAGLRLITLFLTLGVTTSAFANTCVIVVSNDRASTQEIRNHEIAHCECGDWHPPQAWVVPPKGYISPKPPKRCLKYSGELDVMSVPTATAQAVCKRMIGLASYGCYWLE